MLSFCIPIPQKIVGNRRVHTKHRFYFSIKMGENCPSTCRMKHTLTSDIIHFVHKSQVTTSILSMTIVNRFSRKLSQVAFLKIKLAFLGVAVFEQLRMRELSSCTSWMLNAWSRSIKRVKLLNIIIPKTNENSTDQNKPTELRQVKLIYFFTLSV